MTLEAGCWIKYNGPCPSKAHKSDAGYDLYLDESTKIPQHGTKKVSLGTSMKLPSSHFGMLTHRSSLMANHGVTCALGIIDSGYTGIISACLINNTGKDVWLEKGTRVCQLVIIPCREAIFQEKVLEETDRGAGGFGSSGV